MKEAQKAKILRLLKTNPSVTNYQLNRVCLRYSARIHDLRREDYNIVSSRRGGSEWVFALKEPENVS